VTASGLDNGQPFPSLNTMDKPVVNADGSVDIYVGPASPGDGKNWLATVPGKAAPLRPEEGVLRPKLKPGDFEKIR
jgi:hypothetical protein